MAIVSQSESGKAWEYGLARAAADVFSVPLAVNSPRNAAQIAYDSLNEQERTRIDNAASEAIVFLRAHDDALNNTVRVVMQSDMQGRKGDVRDVIVQTGNSKEVGISAKHRHKAVKHSRLSPQIDFGYQWYGQACSEEYHRSVKESLIKSDFPLYFNNLLDKKMHKGVVLDFLGTVLSLALIAGWGIIINFFAFSFSSGVLLASIGIGLYFFVKKLLQTSTSAA